MKIQQIVLRHFRNYKELEWNLTPGVNVLMGANAQGKTNLLEAIGYCSTGRSHRTSYDRECIQIGESDAFIRIVYSGDGMKKSVSNGKYFSIFWCLPESF